MQKVHDQFAFDHSKMNRTIKLLKRNHRWFEMIRDVKQYIRNCHTCRRFKAARDKYQRLLNSLSIFERSWIDITLDFVTSLFESREYNVIFMMIDRLSKMHHYISCIIDENETTAKETTKLLIQHVWKLHELFITMISNRDSQFISLIWDTICKMLKIKAKLFIAFHSETNEQNEIFNQKWKDIFAFTSIINKTIESIDCLWLNMSLMHSSQHLHRYFHFLLIMTVTSSYARNVLFQVRDMFNKLISFFVASLVMTTSSWRAWRLLLALYDSQSSMTRILRFFLFRIHFRTWEEIRARDLSRKRSDQSKRVTCSTRKRVAVEFIIK
jgi:hypothetical protein